jgi:hypothetical protein
VAPCTTLGRHGEGRMREICATLAVALACD